MKPSWFVIGTLLLTACGRIDGTSSVSSKDAGAPASPLGPQETFPPPDPAYAIEMRTRVAAEFYLGHPVICGRGGSNGATCLDTHGSVVWCPPHTNQACIVRQTTTAGLVEKPLE